MKKKYDKKSDYSLAHVLYQRLGNDWYAFTEVDGDCFMTKVDAKVVETKNNQKSTESRKTQKAA